MKSEVRPVQAGCSGFYVGLALPSQRLGRSTCLRVEVDRATGNAGDSNDRCPTMALHPARFLGPSHQTAPFVIRLINGSCRPGLQMVPPQVTTKQLKTGKPEGRRRLGKIDYRQSRLAIFAGYSI